MSISPENDASEMERLNAELEGILEMWQLEHMTGDPKKEPDFEPQKKLGRLIQTGIRDGGFDVEIVALRNDRDSGNSKDYDRFSQKNVIDDNTAMITAVTLLGLGIPGRRYPIIEVPEIRNYIQLIQDKSTQLILKPDEVVSMKFVKHIPVTNY